jgi:peptidoglycan/LPS O-acetylase OafA/YrhL
MQTDKPGTDKTFFPGLNGLRFTAALMVIVHHIEQSKKDSGYVNSYDNVFINSIGGLGVDLFFVLSGFLITYLLIAEKERYKDIKVGQFYLRRILRIWPLYFLLVLSGLFIFPHIPFLYSHPGTGKYLLQKTILFCLILPNIVLMKYGVVPYISQTWSIGVEEQFYLIWPLLLKYTKRYLVALFGVIIFMKALEFILPHALSFLAMHNTLMSLQNSIAFTINYISYLRISCMAIGGLGAYVLYFKKDTILSFIYRRDVQAIVILVSIPLLALGKLYAHSVIFCFLILNISSNPKSLIKLNTSLFDFLGKISYGIYMYHALAIGITLYVLQKMSMQYNDIISNTALYASTILLTIGLATLSYNLFEKRFLGMKKRFTRIESGT